MKSSNGLIELPSYLEQTAARDDDSHAPIVSYLCRFPPVVT